MFVHQLLIYWQEHSAVLTHVRKIAKSGYQIRQVCPSVRLSVRPSVCLPACLSVCLSVRPSVCLSVRPHENSVPTERIFKKLDVILEEAVDLSSDRLLMMMMMTSKIFRKSVQEIQVSLKFYKNNGYFTLRHFHIYGNTSLSSS
jgi:hypothetical protein